MTSKSRSELQSQQSKTMEFIDVDQVLEVPDTPDRLVAATHDHNCNSNERRSDVSINNRIVNKEYTNGRMRSQPREKVKPITANGNPKLFIHPDSCSNPPVPQSSKNSRPTIATARHDKGKALCNSDVQKSTHHVGGNFTGFTDKNGHGQSGISRVNASRKGALPLYSFPTIDSLDKTSKLCKQNNTPKTGPSSDRGKGVDFLAAAHHKAESKASVCMQPCTSSNVHKQKMLVRNGCISPHNIAKSKNIAEKHENGSSIKKVHNGSGTVASNGQSSMVDIKDLIAEAKDSRRFKGKGVSRHFSSEEPDAGSCHVDHRRSIFKEPAESSSDFSLDTKGWRTTHNQRKQRDIGQQKNAMMRMDHRNERDIQHLNESEIVSSPRVCDPPQTMSLHAHNSGINRQMECAASKINGKRSVSCIDVSAGEPSTSSSKRNKSLGSVGPSNPVSKPNSNDDSSIRALQIEADEMLARELQEQLYDEEPTPAVEIDQVDTPLAFAMPRQQDNSSRSARGRHASRRQGPSILNVCERNRSRTSRPSTNQRRLQPRPPFSTRMSQLRSRFMPRHHTITSTSNRRNSIFPPNMDVDLRMEILETLEDFGDMRMRSELLQVGREFNEDDYEMLLALDEDNHRHGGATRAQINNLPESTVHAESSQECAICLETPTIGETIRHLPCLHRFHKACIDQWLRRKTSCPVCKSSVT